MNAPFCTSKLLRYSYSFIKMLFSLAKVVQQQKCPIAEGLTQQMILCAEVPEIHTESWSVEIERLIGTKLIFRAHAFLIIVFKGKVHLLVEINNNYKATIRKCVCLFSTDVQYLVSFLPLCLFLGFTDVKSGVREHSTFSQAWPMNFIKTWGYFERHLFKLQLKGAS